MTIPREYESRSESGRWHFRLSPLEDRGAVGRRWTDLQQSASCSFFQSWGWLGSWLEALPETHPLLVLEARLNDRLAGLALLGRRNVRRHAILSSNALFLSETGDPELDCLTVEHNGFLVDRDVSADVVRETLNALVQLGFSWDELFLSAVPHRETDKYLQAARAAGLAAAIRVEKPDYFVDCEAVRGAGGDYLEALGRNTRYQIRRAMRAYEAQGPMRLEIAKSPEQAAHYFENLRRVHQEYWISRGLPGAFSSPFALDFHRKLIESRFPHGEVQLAEISAGENPLGYLYNFVFDGVVSNYQSAFRYDTDARFKPGLVSHCCAVQHNVDAGMAIYDLLMGDQRYKQNLATSCTAMSWIVVQKPRLRFRLEHAAAGWRRRWLGMLGQPAREAATAADVER